ncbi:FG-GAP repeat domain-containing protein, partial [Streptacidiphilus jiangxiensis]
DVTGDGKADILIYEPDGTIQMGVGTGDGFTNYHEISAGWGGYDGKIKFGDVTGDGKADMEIIQPNGDMTLGVSNGNGFTNYHTISGGWSTFAARLQLA